MNESELHQTQSLISRIIAGVATEVYGYRDMLRLLAGAFIIGGHVLIEGPPGIAKTRTARILAHTLGLKFSRIQFTPDMMPSDITGVYMFDQKKAEFQFVAGPIFADIILADEINRTSPKTQSALLEAMEERTVTIDGRRLPLGEFFWVLATQNPIEHEGTYPLPEAQLDRFLFRIKMSYPEHNDEVQMVYDLAKKTKHEVEWETASDFKPPHIDELKQARAVLHQITLEQTLVDYIVRIAANTRKHPDILLGASPRAALHLAIASKLNALLDGRSYVIPDDVKSMVPHVLGHRIIVDPMCDSSGADAEKILLSVIAEVSVPERSV